VSATTVLFSLGAAVQIPRNTEVVINCAYRDPNQQAQRVGGVDMVAPVAVTDYTFNSEQAGSGIDLTSQLTVDVEFGGNSARVTLTNAGPADGWVPAGGLQLRGRGLYDFEPLIADRQAHESTDLYGEINLAYDMPYQSSPHNGSDLADFLLGMNSQARTDAKNVTFVGNWDDEVAEQAFGIEISDRVSVTAPSIALDAPYYVNGCRMVISSSGILVMTLYLAPVDTTEYWLLEVPGRTELDETTVLGYGLFVPGWILDTSELGSGTFLN
jgi:hypothetical protein